MTSDTPHQGQTTPPPQARPQGRVLTRGQAYDTLVGVCEAVFWSMARRRMP